MNIQGIKICVMSLCFTGLCINAKGQSLDHLKKTNEVQFANYKPAKAKKGKDGSARFGIGKGPKRGNDGKNGNSGATLTVNISLLKIADPVTLQLIVRQTNDPIRVDTYYVNPKLGQIKIMADGGDGGNGGSGENGMDGGYGANGGNGGNGGQGGKIEVFVDSSALSFSDCRCIVYSNEGGKGGDGGNGGYAAESNNSRGSQGRNGNNAMAGPPIYIISSSTKAIISVFKKNTY